MEGDIPVFTTGDVNAFEYGGGILYYQPEYDEMVWQWWDEPLGDGEIEDATYEVYTFRYSPDGDMFKSPHGELDWAAKDANKIADFVGMDHDEFRKMARGNIIEKFMVAEATHPYWHIDHEPFEMSYDQMVRRFDKDLDKAAKNNADKAIEIVEKARSKRGKQLKTKLLR